MTFAVMGKILWVDLSHGDFSEETIPDEVYENYLSGIGLGAYVLYRSIVAHSDPLGSQNVLGFVSGLLSGSGSVCTGRWMAVAKSPLTNTWGEANCGGNLVLALKRCGYDGIFFKGISPKPVYLEILDGKISLKAADDLWGLDAVETERRLRTRAGRGSAVACIGQGGEKLSLISGISNDYGRMAARSGLGAVMGSKRLKALVLRGKQKIEVSDREEMLRLTRAFQRWVNLRIPLPSGALTKYLGVLLRILPFQLAQDGLLYKTLLQIWGTVSMNQVSVEMGDAPIQNWRGSSADFSFRLSDTINPDRITAKEKRKYRCATCPVGCGGEMESEDESAIVHKPEYESVLALSGMLKINDLAVVSEANELLNHAAIDTISAGGTLAFAFECYEQGLITKEDTGGLELTWGNAPAMLALVKMMINRKGIGDILADGSKKAAERLGKGAEAYAVHAGGQELAMHDGRNDPGFTFHYAIEPMPGRHTNGAQLYYEMFKLWTRVKGIPRVNLFYSKDSKYQKIEEKAFEEAANSQFMQVVNGAGGCLFGTFFGVHRLPVFEWLNAATGWQKTPNEYMEIGARIQTLKQSFNAREDIPLLHAIHPRALGIPPQAAGANRGRSVDLQSFARYYWKVFGWNEQTGRPTPETLSRLGIDFI